MTRMRRPAAQICAALTALAGTFFGGAVRADTIFLENGDELQGTIVENNGATVVVQLPSGVKRSVRRADVVDIVYDRRTAPVITPTAPAAEGDGTAPPANADGSTPPVDPSKAPLPPATAEKEKEKEKDDPDKETDPAVLKALAAEKAWTPPEGLANFPRLAKRMSREYEAQFMDALKKASSADESERKEAKNTMANFGLEGVPYIVAGTNDASVFARTTCMTILGEMGAKSAIKQVIEVTFAATRENDRPAHFQTPFLTAARETLKALTGEAFVNTRANDTEINNGVQMYIDWYNKKYGDTYDKTDRLISDTTVPDTAKSFGKRLKESRKLVLQRREWPTPPQPTDEINRPTADGRPSVPAGALERQGDKDYGKTFSREGNKGNDILKRPQDR